MRVPRSHYENPGSGPPDPVSPRPKPVDARRASATRRRGARREPPDETLLARRPYYYAAGVLALFSLLMRQPLLFVAALLLTAITLLPEVWYRFGLRQLVVVREPAARRASFGDVIDVRVLVENRKPLPLPSLEVVDELPDGLPVIGSSLGASNRPARVHLTHHISLWAYQRVRRRFRVHAVNRGAFQLGPTLLRSGDPFGMMTRDETRKAHATVLVHPLIAPIERFGLPAIAPFGEQKSARKLLEDPLRVAGIRAYMPGDEPRRIHWKATARTGSLQSKVYDPATRHSIVLFYDVRTYLRPVMGYDPALVELGICAAASLATWALDHGYATGLYSNGTLQLTDDEPEGAPPDRTYGDLPRPDDVTVSSAQIAQRLATALRLHIAPAAHPGQHTRILDGLARLLPFYGLPMDQVIASEQSRLPPGAVVLYVGAEIAVDVPLLVALRHLRTRGHEVSLLLLRSTSGLDASPDGPLPFAGFPVHYLGDRALWRTLVSDALGTDDDELMQWYEAQQVERRGTESPAAAAEAARETTTADEGASSENGAGDDAAADGAKRPHAPRTPRPLVVE